MNRPGEPLADYRPDLTAALESHPAYRKQQVFQHLMRGQMEPFAQATSLPADLRATLDDAGSTTLKTVASRAATDGTTKLLLECRDGSRVETVVMHHGRRTTACISSQVGCPVGCGFCATGCAGFRRNLSVAEIVDQARCASATLVEDGRRLSNLVYMGMGEPLLNLQAILASIRVLTHPDGLNLGHRSLSVSTIGIPSGIVRLAKAEPQVNLALSLHATTDKVRRSLIPSSHCHRLEDVLAAAWQHFELTRRKLLVEYVLLSGINDSGDDARRLASLLRGHVVTVNLLSWNPVVDASGEDSSGFAPSPRARVRAFRDVLRTRGIEVTIRQSKGADIEGACGQLAGRYGSYSSGEEGPP